MLFEKPIFQKMFGVGIDLGTIFMILIAFWYIFNTFSVSNFASNFDWFWNAFDPKMAPQIGPWATIFCQKGEKCAVPPTSVGILSPTLRPTTPKNNPKTHLAWFGSDFCRFWIYVWYCLRVLIDFVSHSMNRWVGVLCMLRKSLGVPTMRAAPFCTQTTMLAAVELGVHCTLPVRLLLWGCHFVYFWTSSLYELIDFHSFVLSNQYYFIDTNWLISMVLFD